MSEKDAAVGGLIFDNSGDTSVTVRHSGTPALTIAKGAVTAPGTLTSTGTLATDGALTAGTGVTATTGNITASTGDFVATAGDVTASSGTVTAATFTKASSYTRKIQLPGSLWAGGATTAGAIGGSQVSGIYGYWFFDADAESICTTVNIPEDWDGASDMVFKVMWTNEGGTAIGDGETVIWDVDFHVAKVDGSSTVVAGTDANATATYTQTGAGTDYQVQVTSITLDYDNANQPLAAGDILGLELRREFSTDTYGSDAYFYHAWIEYQSTNVAGE